MLCRKAHASALRVEGQSELKYTQSLIIVSMTENCFPDPGRPAVPAGLKLLVVSEDFSPVESPYHAPRGVGIIELGTGRRLDRRWHEGQPVVQIDTVF